jgi:hypothetical protein
MGKVPVVCQLTFKEGIPRNYPATAAIHLQEPKLTTLWAAGFSFSKCHAELLVPYDPNLLQIFDGEEFSRGARLWVHTFLTASNDKKKKTDYLMLHNIHVFDITDIWVRLLRAA